MKDAETYIRARLSEFKQRHTGKDPFGPATDLRLLAESLDDNSKRIFEDILNQKQLDDFWKPFIKMYRDQGNH